MILIQSYVLVQYISDRIDPACTVHAHGLAVARGDGGQGHAGVRRSGGRREGMGTAGSGGSYGRVRSCGRGVGLWTSPISVGFGGRSAPLRRTGSGSV